MAKTPESCPPVKARTQFESALQQAEASLQKSLQGHIAEVQGTGGD